MWGSLCHRPGNTQSPGRAHGSRNVQTGRRFRAPRRAKNGGACGTAKFREETSKKADSATRGRIAAVHKVGGRIVRPQGIFCGAAFTKAGHGPPCTGSHPPLHSRKFREQRPHPATKAGCCRSAPRSTQRGLNALEAQRTVVSCLAEQSEAPIGRLSHEWHSFSGRRDIPPAVTYRRHAAGCGSEFLWAGTAIVRPNLANSTGPYAGHTVSPCGYMTRHVKEVGGRRAPQHGRYRVWDY